MGRPLGPFTASRSDQKAKIRKKLWSSNLLFAILLSVTISNQTLVNFRGLKVRLIAMRAEVEKSYSEPYTHRSKSHVYGSAHTG